MLLDLAPELIQGFLQSRALYYSDIHSGRHFVVKLKNQFSSQDLSDVLSHDLRNVRELMYSVVKILTHYIFCPLY